MQEQTSVGQVQCELDRLNKVSTVVLTRLETLSGRLGLVLRPLEPSTAPDVQGEKAMVPLASSIRDQRALVSEAVDRIDSILDRLEV